MKYLKILKNSFSYYLIYIFTIFLCTIPYNFICGITDGSNGTTGNSNDRLLKNLVIISAIAAILTLRTYIQMFRKQEISLSKICKFKKVNLRNSLIVILCSFGLVLFSSSLVDLLMSKFPSYIETSKIISSNTNSILGIISIILILPLFEEILFRGLIFNDLKKHLNITIAIVIQGFLFAIAHGNILQSIYTFILGIVLAIVYDKLNSIIAPMLLHVTYNLLGSILIPILSSIINGTVILYLALGLIMFLISLFLLFTSAEI